MGLEIEVNLSSEQINQLVQEAIAKSIIGEKLKDQIETTIKDITQSYRDPFQPIIQQYINDSIKQVVMEKYLPYIEETVKNRLTTELVHDLIDKMWTAFKNQYR